MIILEAGGSVSNIKGEDIGLTNYINSALKTYLDSYDPTSTEAMKERFNRAVKADQGTLIAASNQTLLLSNIAPAQNSHRCGL